jgi:ribose transport system ATP-binding protein
MPQLNQISQRERLLTANGLSKAFAGVHALEEVSFDVRGGEVHALLGENGAGKSTLVKVISGVLRADSGEVRLRDEPFMPRDPGASLAAGVGVVFQELPLIPDLTVMENIFFNRQPLSPVGTVARRRMRARAEELFASIGLAGINPTRQVRDLSVAARQLVAIAKVLAAEPDIVVLDEATSALGPSEVTWLFERTRALAAAGKGIVFISHRLAEADEISDRVTVLRNGRNVGTWTAGGISPDGLISAMLGRPLEQLYPERHNTPRDEIVLAVRQLTAGRRLHGVDFDLRRGEILGICGLEGQGQLELFLSLYGVIRSRGSIVVEGQARRLRSPRDALRAGLGLALVPEDRKNEGILPTLSMRENISLPSLRRVTRLGLINRGAERQLITPVIRDLRIGREDPEQLVGGLSGGNQQKVIVGKFLLTGAKILLFYDLTRGVDVGTKAEIFKMMEQLATEGYAVLFFSTDLAELVNVPHRTCVMFDGRIVAEFARGSVTQEGATQEEIARAEVTQEKLVAAMVGGTSRADGEVSPVPGEPAEPGGEP